MKKLFILIVMVVLAVCIGFAQNPQPGGATAKQAEKVSSEKTPVTPDILREYAAKAAQAELELRGGKSNSYQHPRTTPILRAPAELKCPGSENPNVPTIGGKAANTGIAYLQNTGTQAGLATFNLSTFFPTTFLSTTLSAIYGGTTYNGKFYGYHSDVDYGSGNPTDVTFYTVNATTGAVTNVIPRPELYGNVVDGVCYDFTSDIMYAVSSPELYSVNLTTGELTHITTITGVPEDEFEGYVLCMAIDVHGNMYILTPGNSRLYSVNKTTGVATLIGLTGVLGVNYAQSMAFDHNTGKLYWHEMHEEGSLAYMNYREINVNTGASTLLVSNTREVTAFSVPFEYNGNAPTAVANYTATPGATGALNVTLNWTNPTHTLAGNPLTALTAIKIYNASDALIHTISNPTIGAPETYYTTVPNAGLYTYKVVAENAAGAGLSTTITLWLGVDMPGAAENVVLARNGWNATLTWNAPTKGMNGGYFDPTGLLYDVYRNGTQLVASNTTSTTFTESLSNPGNYFYKIVSKSAAGTGASVNSKLMNFKGVQQVQWDESFSGEVFPPFGWDQFKYGQLSNAKFFRYSGSGLGHYHTAPAGVMHDWDLDFLTDNWLVSPPIELPADRPCDFSFWNEFWFVKWYRISAICISAESCDPNSGDFVLVKTWTKPEVVALEGTSTDPRWEKFTIPLDDYIGKTIHIAFAYYGEDGHAWFFDDLKVFKRPEHDLEAGIYGPVSIPQNKPANYHVQVVNKGIHTESGYTVKLKVKNTYPSTAPFVDLGTVPGNPIAPGDTQFYKITWTNPSEFANYHIVGEIIHAADEYPDNDNSPQQFMSVSAPNTPVWLYKMGFEETEDWQSWQWFNYGGVSRWWRIPYGDAYELDAILMYSTEKDANADDWVVGPNIYFEPDKAYKVSFWTTVLAPGFPERLAFYLAAGPTPQDAVGKPLWEDKFLDEEEWTQKSVTLSGMEALHNFAYHCTSSKAGYGVLVDFFLIEEINAVQGTVTSTATSQPVQGAKIQATGYAIPTYTDAVGHYVHGINNFGTHQFTASKLGYYDEVKTVNVTTNGQVIDFTLAPRTAYTVTGKVTGNDTGGAGIGGVKVTLSGYEYQETITNSNGDYSFSTVYGDFTYAIAASIAGRAPYVGEVSVNGANVIHNIVLTELLFPPSSITVSEVSASATNANVNWTAPNGMIDKVYIFDDGTMEDGYQFNQGFDVALGNKFPVTESGVITSVDLYSWANPLAGDDRNMTINIYDANRNYIGKSEPFLFNQKTTQWINVKLPNINFSGEFYAMLTWTSVGFDQTNFLGFDENGPYTDADLGWWLYEGQWFPFVDINPYFYPSVLGIRAHVNHYGKSMVYNPTGEGALDTEETTGGEKAFTGYNLYRGLKGTPLTGWTSLQTNTTSLTYTDNNVWNTLSAGVYQYAVEAVYTGGYSSTALLSSDMPIKMKVPFTVNITTNDGAPATGAIVRLNNQDDELDLLYQKTAGATGTTFDEIWRGIYSITVTLPGYSTYRNVDINITQDNTPAYTVNLTEMLYPVEEVNWSVSGNDMLITWSEPTQDIGKTYFYDDGTAENAWTPGSSEMHIGTKFPVTESGEITAIELFQMADYNAGPRRVSIEIFNDKYEKVGASEKFMFNEPENKWITIPMPNVPYSGTFYAMIRWHFSGTSYYSNLIGVDENGPNANANLDYVRLADGTFVIMHVEWGWHPNMTACIPMIRAHVNSLGKSMTYGYDTEFGVNSAYRTPEPKSTISTQDYPLFCAKEKGLIDETTQTPAWVAPKSGKSHIGYNLYRLIAGQTEPSWTTLGTNLDVNSKIDVDNLVSGTDYYWAVKAVYTNNTVSAPRFSPICPFGRIASVSAYVKTNSGDPVNGARFILSHSNGNPAYIYQRTLNTNNVSINNVLKGSYKLTIELEGYNTYVATVAINDDLSDLGTITLIEIIEKPFKLEIKNVSSCKQVLSWNNITNPFITLNVPTDVWGDASGYQMLLDETAVSYFGSNPFVSCSNIVPAVYNGFNYRIPVGATPACEKATANPNNWVFMNSKTIQVPPGTYDFITINPEVGNALWVPYGEDARRDNFVFEADKHYTFTVTPIIDEDGDVSSDLVTLSVTNAKSSGEGSSKSINSRSFLGFRIYMDGVEVAITKNTEYAFENVPAGAHTAGVQAVYSSGESQIVTINFTSTCTNPPQLTFTITAASENTTLGTATGGGEYKMYEPVVVEATAKEGYEFKYWSENGEWTSYNSRYEFLATANRALVAVFGLPSSVIENALSNIVLYPNPFNNEINISNPEIVKNVQITNLTGQIVKTVNFNGKAISTGDLGIGIYFVTIESITGEKVTMKMVKI